jgi:hypothetical protein
VPVLLKIYFVTIKHKYHAEINSNGKNMDKILKTRSFIAGAVALVTAAVFLATLRNGFVNWDDANYVYDNPHIRSLDLTFFRWAFLDFYAANWHPLSWLSHGVDYAIWGLNPLGHHLTNNILHALNTFLVVLLVAGLLKASEMHPYTCLPPSQERRKEENPLSEKRGGKDSQSKVEGSEENSPPLRGGDKGEGEKKNSRLTIEGSRFTLITAGVTGLLFGLHPLHVESVAWVAERKDLLCAFFFLLSIITYTQYAIEVNASGPVNSASRFFNRKYLLAIGFFTLSLLSKPMAVSLPLVLLILDWYLFGRIQSLKAFWAAAIEKLPFLALALFHQS